MSKTTNSYFESYEYIKDDLKFLTNSKIRIRILNCLLRKPLSMKEIHKNTGLSYSSISNNIHKLEEKDYITRKSNQYHLKNLIRMILTEIIDFNESFKLVNSYSKLWMDHNIKVIDEKFLKEISSLKDSEIIKSTPTDIYKPHNMFKSLLNESTNVKSIIPFLHPEYVPIFENLIKKEVDIDLLIPQSVSSVFIESMNQDTVKKGFKDGNFKIKSLDDEVKISLTIANNFLSLGLFKLDNSYDQNRLLISYSPQAIDWGYNVFEFYKKTKN